MILCRKQSLNWYHIISENTIHEIHLKLPIILAFCTKLEILAVQVVNVFKKSQIYFSESRLRKHELKMVMAHELGHAILHTKQNCYFIRNKTLLLNSKIEKEANIFAATLLISEDELSEYKDYTLKQLSKILGYSEQLIQLRIQ